MTEARDVVQQERRAHVMAKAVGIGCIAGLLLGVIIGNIPIGVVTGLSISLVAGAAFSAIRGRHAMIRIHNVAEVHGLGFFRKPWVLAIAAATAVLTFLYLDGSI